MEPNSAIGGAPSSGPAPHRRFAAVVLDLLLVTALLIAGLGLFRHVRAVIDVDLFDETSYLHRGDDVAAAFQTPDNGPLYSAYYHLLSAVWPDRLDVYYVNYVALTMLLPCAMYVCLRSYRASRRASLAAATLLLLCHGNFPLTPKIGHFALILLLCALAVARRCRGATRKLALLLTAALVVSYARPEFFLAAALFGSWLALRATRLARAGGLRPALPVIASAFGVAVLAIGVLGFPLQGSDRSFMAFGQHYSLHRVAWSGTNVDPWTSWPEIIDHDFRGARSIVGAVMASPVLFLRHLAYNIRDLGPNTVGSMLRVAFAPMYFVAGSLVVAAGCAALYRRRVRGAITHTLAGARRIACERSVDALAPAVLSLPAWVSVLIIFPRAHYILMAFVLLLVVGVAAYVRATPESVAAGGDRASVAAVLVLISVAWIFPYRTVPPTRTLDTAISIRFLRTLRPAPITALAPEGDYAAYLPNTVTIVHASDLAGPSSRPLQDIDVVVAPESMRTNALLSSDARRLFDDPARFGFHPQPVAGLRRTMILVRDGREP